MITPQLIKPRSIAVIGASEDTSKPGGKVLLNILNGTFDGEVITVNPKATEIQGIRCMQKTEDLPQTDLAVLAIPARFCAGTIEILLHKKQTKAVIVLSAGFSEMGAEGKALEKKMVQLCTDAHATLIGPNCIGVINTAYQSAFTTPIPKLSPNGCDFISGSGATALFIMESTLSKGLSYASIYSVGNAAQTGVEDMVAHLDNTFNPDTSSHTLLLYMESIDKPQKLLAHAQSLVKKGCRIAAIKSGTSDDGGRAAASHTGAILNSGMAVDALFEKAGVIRCHSREELGAVGSVLQHPPLKGKNIAVITHAGGPAVMLTDALANGGLCVPALPKEKTEALLAELFEGSSVANPIDILATGTATQLQRAINTCENNLEMINGIVVIFGSSGLFSSREAYNVIRQQQKICKKPIFAVLPSVINSKAEMQQFVEDGGIYFDDEVLLANALSKIYNTLPPYTSTAPDTLEKASEIRTLLSGKKGLLPTEDALKLLDLVGITRPKEALVTTENEAIRAAQSIGFPIAMKVVGLAHKSDAGGVILNVLSKDAVKVNFAQLMQIANAKSVQISQMESGTEILIGVKKEDNFGHLITCGLGGIFVEVMKDIQSALAPLSGEEALRMIRALKSYPIIRGVRGKEGVDENVIADTLCKVSALLSVAPEIKEMDINPLIGTGKRLSAVDIVIKI